MVYLDLSHKDPEELNVKLGGILDIYEKFVGEDPRKVPMRIFPAVHYSMGGLWVDYDQMTNIPGIFAAGEVSSSTHGAVQLRVHSLVSGIYGGGVAGTSAIEYTDGLSEVAKEKSSKILDDYVKKEEEKFEELMKMDGGENAYQLHQELGEWMTDKVTVVRENDRLLKTDEKIQELLERWENISLTDTSRWSNQGVMFTRQLKNMLHLARVITIGAYNRDESRGAHYKPEFPDRNDEEWLKTTIASFNEKNNAPDISYEEVDTSLIKPRKRDYTKVSERSS